MVQEEVKSALEEMMAIGYELRETCGPLIAKAKKLAKELQNNPINTCETPISTKVFEAIEENASNAAQVLDDLAGDFLSWITG